MLFPTCIQAKFKHVNVEQSHYSFSGWQPYSNVDQYPIALTILQMFEKFLLCGWLKIYNSTKTKFIWPSSTFSKHTGEKECH